MEFAQMSASELQKQHESQRLKQELRKQRNADMTNAKAVRKAERALGLSSTLKATLRTSKPHLEGRKTEQMDTDVYDSPEDTSSADDEPDDHINPGLWGLDNPVVEDRRDNSTSATRIEGTKQTTKSLKEGKNTVITAQYQDRLVGIPTPLHDPHDLDSGGIETDEDEAHPGWAPDSQDSDMEIDDD